MSPAEARQLRGFTCILLLRMMSRCRARVIVRPGGQRAEAEVTKSQADAEGHEARELLKQFNQIPGRPSRLLPAFRRRVQILFVHPIL